MSLPFLVFLAAWLVGMVCTFIPAVPATLIIFLGSVAAALLDGFQAGRDLPFLLVFGVVTLFIMSIDNVASAWGARKYGGGKEAMWGALVGGLVGAGTDGFATWRIGRYTDRELLPRARR